MNYYLLDFENVKSSGFDGVEKLSEQDKVIAFYSVNSGTITIDMHIKINKSKADIEFQKVFIGGKNALDFQLSSYLGYLIRDTLPTEDNAEMCNYYIVSNDTGYDFLCKYWKNQGVEVKIVSSISGENPAKNEEEKSSPPDTHITNKNDLEKTLKTILPDKTDAPIVAKIINQYKTKQGVNNGLTKTFPQQKVGPIYKAIKSLIADKKGQ
ncbi:hypothetical protein SELR_pSRC200960 (plasmid) [Selenomonas ruminantium subsp. lactilytica TAM6421]|uniref:PIN-like domain-containing protein n=1 Tax=Selenomonas ruminantium subsp. lactilytica (strain NBRC 103574 / TAM6421) TaxID=927704 RepID=I0GV43_SELRL|nr:PIN domain-containing protein [Selenomonas ruminantium]BAL84630.1 hypothetical protein SELR_pSRC200960 [Selenomonas ruminantium subsp. lactilytica TAM6421]